VTQDPIGLWGGVNGFVYPTNPVGWVDPLGLQQTPHIPTQGDNARNTAINGAATVFPNSGGAVLTAGSTALDGGLLILDTMESLAFRDYLTYKSTGGEHLALQRKTCVLDLASQHPWVVSDSNDIHEDYKVFQPQYADMAQQCMKK
jgi:hypothetical protein